MFEKRFCTNCGKRIKSEWKYCPYCGKRRAHTEMTFESVSDALDKEFERIDKMFDSFNFPKVGGIHITIQSGPIPKVRIKTHDEDKKAEPKTERIKQEIKIPKVTEEPETEIQKTKDKQIIFIKLPDVKSEDDIEIKKLEQSVEVRAFAGDKAYFKLIPISHRSDINKKFKDGMLILEISL